RHERIRVRTEEDRIKLAEERAAIRDYLDDVQVMTLTLTHEDVAELTIPAVTAKLRRLINLDKQLGRDEQSLAFYEVGRGIITFLREQESEHQLRDFTLRKQH